MLDPAQKKPLLLIPVRADAGTWPPPRNGCRRCCRPPAAASGADRNLANVVVEESYTLAAIGRGKAPDTRRIEDERKLLALEAGDGNHHLHAQRPAAGGARASTRKR